MSTVWKVLAGLALVVPMGAYVAGSLAASASDDPAPRRPVVLHERPSGPTRSSTPTPSSEPEVIVPGYDDLDDHGDDHGGDRHGGHGRHRGHGRHGGED